MNIGKRFYVVYYKEIGEKRWKIKIDRSSSRKKCMEFIYSTEAKGFQYRLCRITSENGVKIRKIIAEYIREDRTYMGL